MEGHVWSTEITILSIWPGQLQVQTDWVLVGLQGTHAIDRFGGSIRYNAETSFMMTSWHGKIFSITGLLCPPNGYVSQGARNTELFIAVTMNGLFSKRWFGMSLLSCDLTCSEYRFVMASHVWINFAWRWKPERIIFWIMSNISIPMRRL